MGENILPIRKAPAFNQVNLKLYDSQFVGMLNKTDNNKVIIDDHIYYLNIDSIIINKNGTYLNEPDFCGSMIIYSLNSFNEIIYIKELK